MACQNLKNDYEELPSVSTTVQMIRGLQIHSLGSKAAKLKANIKLVCLRKIAACEYLHCQKFSFEIHEKCKSGDDTGLTMHYIPRDRENKILGLGSDRVFCKSPSKNIAKKYGDPPDKKARKVGFSRCFRCYEMSDFPLLVPKVAPRDGH